MTNHIREEAHEFENMENYKSPAEKDDDDKEMEGFDNLVMKDNGDI